MFECLSGIYRQKDGLPMGSSLSPLLANIYVAMFEQSVVKKLQKEGKVVVWLRYADDILAVIKKRSMNTVLEKINAWDTSLNFTVEKMVNEKINFLDSTVFIEKGEIKFRKFWKNGPGTVTSNYRTSVMPKKIIK